MMMNLIVLDDKDVDESSKKFFKTIVTECGYLEDFTQALARKIPSLQGGSMKIMQVWNAPK